MANTQPRDTAPKNFGIQVTLPTDDTFAASHLLGEDWTSDRWFATAQERDAVFASMQTQPKYYRVGDSPSIRLVKIDR